MNPRESWNLAYRAARLACRDRQALAFDPLAGDWTKTPRGPATHAIVQAAADAIGYVAFDAPNTPHWKLQIVNGMVNSLRLIVPMRLELRETVLNAFGMLSGWRCVRVENHRALNDHRHDLIRRLDARDLLTRDAGNWIRRVALPLGRSRLVALAFKERRRPTRALPAWSVELRREAAAAHAAWMAESEAA